MPEVVIPSGIRLAARGKNMRGCWILTTLWQEEDRKMEQITVKEILEATGGRLLCGSPDTPLDHVSIDSRTMKGNDLFVPLVGEKGGCSPLYRAGV